MQALLSTVAWASAVAAGKHESNLHRILLLRQHFCIPSGSISPGWRTICLTWSFFSSFFTCFSNSTRKQTMYPWHCTSQLCPKQAWTTDFFADYDKAGPGCLLPNVLDKAHQHNFTDFISGVNDQTDQCPPQAFCYLIYAVERIHFNSVLSYCACLLLLYFSFPFPVCYCVGLAMDAEQHSDTAQRSASEFPRSVFEIPKCNFQI